MTTSMTDPYASATAARKQGIFVGLVIGLIVGAVGGGLLAAFLPAVTQSTPVVGGGNGKPAKAVLSTPVAISTSGAAGAKVVVVKNTSDKALNGVSLEVTRPRTREGKKMDLGTIEPGATKELGSREWDWQMTTGDVVEVSADGFSAVGYTEP